MKKVFAAILAAAMITASFSACGGTGSASSAATPASSDNTTVASSEAASSAAGLSGSINISGSSALQPLVQAAADEFKKTNPNLSITVNAGGSGTGLQNVSDKTVGIGDSDIFATEKLSKAKSDQLVDHIVCVVGVAAVVSPDVTVTSVTKQQLADIFTGKATNWKDLGGADEKITIINRPKSSGTRTLFKAYALGGKEEATGQALSEDNSGLLKQQVAQTKGAIAYLAFSYLTDHTVKSLSIDGVAPNYDNVYGGKYNVWGYEHMYTNGEATDPAKSFLDYIANDPNAQKIMTDKGYGLSSKMTVKRVAPAPKS